MGRRWWQKEARVKAEEERLASKRAAALLKTASEAIKDGHITVAEVISVAAAVEEVVEAVYNDFVSDKDEKSPDQNDGVEKNNVEVEESVESEETTEEKIENAIEAAAPIAAAIVTKVVNNNQNHKNNINKNKRRR